VINIGLKQTQNSTNNNIFKQSRDSTGDDNQLINNTSYTLMLLESERQTYTGKASPSLTGRGNNEGMVI
jgi:hypothetical protein